MKLLKNLCFFLFPLLLAGCALDDGLYEDSLPHAPVRLELDLYGEDSQLNEPMSMFFIDEVKYQGERLGHGGIIVVHTHGDQYSAYDMVCPYEYPSRYLLEHYDDPNMPLCVFCPRCGSVYDLYDGWGRPVRGSRSRTPLQEYHVSVYRGMINISN